MFYVSPALRFSPMCGICSSFCAEGNRFRFVNKKNSCVFVNDATPERNLLLTIKTK